MSYACVRLHMPPSANALWRPSRSRGMIKTAEYESWRRGAGQEVMAMRRGMQFSADVEVTLIAHRTNMRRDPDNLIKPTLDALQFGQLLTNDLAVVSIAARWAKDFDTPLLQGRDVVVELRCP